MADDVFITTKTGLRIEVKGLDDEGELRTLHYQLDRVSAQLLARRLLQLAGNDKEFSDPGLGEHIFAKPVTKSGGHHPGRKVFNEARKEMAATARGIPLVKS